MAALESASFLCIWMPACCNRVLVHLQVTQARTRFNWGAHAAATATDFPPRQRCFSGQPRRPASLSDSCLTLQAAITALRGPGQLPLHKPAQPHARWPTPPLLPPLRAEEGLVAAAAALGAALGESERGTGCWDSKASRSCPEAPTGLDQRCGRACIGFQRRRCCRRRPWATVGGGRHRCSGAECLN